MRGPRGRRYSLAVSPDGRQLAGGSREGTLDVWSLVNGDRLHTLKRTDCGITDLAFTADGRRIVSASEDGKITFWNANTATVSDTVDLEFNLAILALSTDGTRVVCTGPGDGVTGPAGGVKILDTATGEVIHCSDAIASCLCTGLSCIPFQADCRRIVFVEKGSKDVITWDAVANEVQRHHHEGHYHFPVPDTGSPAAFAISPDGTRIVIEGNEQLLMVRDAVSGKRQCMLIGHGARARCIAFSADGKRIATGSDDETVRIWDTATGRHRATLRGHNSPVTNVLFAPNGKRVISRAEDGRLKAWDVTL